MTPGSALATRRDWRHLEALVAEAATAFSALPTGDEDRMRTVFVSGDLMTKGNDFANGGATGARVLGSDLRPMARPRRYR